MISYNQSLVQSVIIEINKNHFTFQYVIGRGGFGKVWKVELKKEKRLYAMKEMAKARIISKRSVNSVMNEKKFLCQLNHPFLVNMQYAFEDRENLYLVIDLMSGGDLRYHIGKKRQFTEEQTSKCLRDLSIAHSLTISPLVCRIFHCVHAALPGILAQERHFAQGYQA